MVILTAAKSAQSALNFITGSEIISTIDAIGGVEAAAAKLAFQGFPTARDRRNHLYLAIGHLQSAHEAFRRGWTKYDNALGKAAMDFVRIDFMDKDIITCSMMAICYAILGDKTKVEETMVLIDRPLKVRIEHFESDFSWGETAKMFLSMLNPENLKVVIFDNGPDSNNPFSSRTEALQFRENLLKIATQSAGLS